MPVYFVGVTPAAHPALAEHVGGSHVVREEAGLGSRLFLFLSELVGNSLCVSDFNPHFLILIPHEAHHFFLFLKKSLHLVEIVVDILDFFFVVLG